jgi:hypothetical protein
MAAIDAFDNYLNTLSAEDKEKLKTFIAEQRAEMLAARSEDARVRLTHEFIEEVRQRLRKK